MVLVCCLQPVSEAQNPETELMPVEIERVASLSPARFDLRAEEASLRSVLSMLALSAGLNLVLDAGIEETVTLDLRGVNLSEALDAILSPLGLGYDLDRTRAGP